MTHFSIQSLRAAKGRVFAGVVAGSGSGFTASNLKVELLSPPAKAAFTWYPGMASTANLNGRHVRNGFWHYEAIFLSCIGGFGFVICILDYSATRSHSSLVSVTIIWTVIPYPRRVWSRIRCVCGGDMWV